MRDLKYSSYVMWSLPLIFFAFQFILRLWPGLMVDEIMIKYEIDASLFGLMQAFYYAGYAGFQIPVAMMLDTFSARNVVFVSALVCGFGTLAFTFTDHFYVSLFSRFLIGAGSASGFLGVSKVITEWFPKKQYTKMVGISFTLGFIGAIYGGKPVGVLIEHYDPQLISSLFAMISIGIGMMSYAILRSPRKTEGATDEEKFCPSAFLSILTTKSILMLGFIMLLLVGTIEGFADIWGIPYLMKSYDLTKPSAAGTMSMIYIGILFGGPFLAFVSQKIGNYMVMLLCALAVAITFGLLFSTQNYYSLLIGLMLFVLGITYCYQVVTFAAASDIVAPQYLGVTIAFLNCMGMIGGSFFHVSIGKILDLFWTGVVTDEGLKQYDLIAYKYAIGIIPLAAIIGAVIVFGMMMNSKRRYSAEPATQNAS
jgi:MFS family permease